MLSELSLVLHRTRRSSTGRPAASRADAESDTTPSVEKAPVPGASAIVRASRPGPAYSIINGAGATPGSSGARAVTIRVPANSTSPAASRSSINAVKLSSPPRIVTIRSSFSVSCVAGKGATVSAATRPSPAVSRTRTLAMSKPSCASAAYDRAAPALKLGESATRAVRRASDPSGAVGASLHVIAASASANRPRAREVGRSAVITYKDARAQSRVTLGGRRCPPGG